MKYTSLSDSSFQLQDGGTVYALPSYFSLWQIRQITKVVAELTKACSKSGSVLATVLLSTFNDSGSVEATIKNIEKATGGLIGPQAIEGVGELLEFLSEEYRLAKVIASLYLAKGETKLSDEDLQARAIIFEEHVDPRILVTGVKSFFSPKAKQSMSSDSPSKTSEVTKKRSSNRTVASSIGTSTVLNA